MTIPDALRRGAMAVALLPVAGCDRQPERFHVATPGEHTLPAQPATGTHYAHSAWATVHRYLFPFGEQPYPQTRKIVVGQFDTANGELLGWFESRDASGAFVIPDADGSMYLSLSGTATSIGYYGVDPKLPGFLRANLEPRAGLVALKPAPSR